MTPGTQIILSGTLTFGVPLALAVRDLLITRRTQGGSWDPEPPKPVPPTPAGGGNANRRPLPQCLIDAATIRPTPLNHTRPLERV